MMNQGGKSTNKSIIKEAKKNTPSKASRTEQAINKSLSSATKTVSKVQIVDQILSKIQVSVHSLRIQIPLFFLGNILCIK
jgi:hypothetical protein